MNFRGPEELPDKFRPVENILADANLTVAGKFVMLLDQVPTCICGDDCRTLRYKMETGADELLAGILDEIL